MAHDVAAFEPGILDRDGFYAAFMQGLFDLHHFSFVIFPVRPAGQLPSLFRIRQVCRVADHHITVAGIDFSLAAFIGGVFHGLKMRAGFDQRMTDAKPFCELPLSLV